MRLQGAAFRASPAPAMNEDRPTPPLRDIDARALRDGFAGVNAWIVDLDNTLYSPEVRLFSQIEARMTAYVQRVNSTVSSKTALNALTRLLAEGRSDLVDTYSDRALARVWRCTHFSWWMTSMLHTHGDDFDAQLQLSQLRRVCSSEAAARELAENYTGLPVEA